MTEEEAIQAISKLGFIIETYLNDYTNDDYHYIRHNDCNVGIRYCTYEKVFKFFILEKCNNTTKDNILHDISYYKRRELRGANSLVAPQKMHIPNTGRVKKWLHFYTEEYKILKRYHAERTENRNVEIKTIVGMGGKHKEGSNFYEVKTKFFSLVYDMRVFEVTRKRIEFDDFKIRRTIGYEEFLKRIIEASL